MGLARNSTRFPLVLLGFWLLTGTSIADAGDWPQWRGPDRDGKSSEIELLQEWPEAGPKLIWQANDLGHGYGAPSVADGQLYLHLEDGDVMLVDVNTEAFRQRGKFTPPNRPEGEKGKPWAYPLIANGRLYIRESGTLWCYDIKK